MAGDESRGRISETERLKVYVRSGGRCAICGKYLLEGELTHRPMRLGELAHIVGAMQTPGSPRGIDPLPKVDREMAENLMLVCRDQHTELDRRGTLDVMTVEKLRSIKRDHEAWIRRMTGLDRNRGTAVLRMLGQIRGNTVELARPTASSAILESADRFPDFPLSHDLYGIEIDLQRLPGEGTNEYWSTGMAAIDNVIEHKLKDAVADGTVQHVSVFAFARLPLLVYLGSRLDDTYGVEVYQRHRSTDAWAWPNTDAPAPRFEVRTERMNDAPANSSAVLILNVSGTVSPDELPEELRGLNRYVLAPAGGNHAGVDVINSPAAVATFRHTVRSLLSDLEVSTKRMPALHVVGALPVAAAVALGQAHDPHVHPKFAIYSRTDGGAYEHALDLA
ncbi:SAVED domain-containing protein [Micrococcus luteus]|nr:SAVED domain-containing protein [Micrococcus luteus]